MSEAAVRQHDCSDDADHPALASKSPCDVAGIFLCVTTRRRSLLQREMGTILEIVEDVFVDQAFQMPPFENDHMVEQIPAAVAYPAFRNPVLPWTSETGALGLNAETLHSFDHFTVELRAAIKDYVAGGRVIGKRLAQLLNDPCTRRMARHLTLKNAPPVMRDDEKAVEHSEGQRGHSKEIHRGDGFPMIAQKRCPSLGRLRTPGRSPHPAQHGSLRNIEAKHLQFAVDTRCAPCRIFRDHSKDEIAQFLTDAFSARSNLTPREPCPIQLEPCTVPANNSFWLNEDQRLPPVRPEPPQDHPKQLVGSRDRRARFPLLQNDKLLAKSQVLKQQVAARAKDAEKEDRQRSQQAPHEVSIIRANTK